MHEYEVTFELVNGMKYSRVYTDWTSEEAAYAATLDLIFNTDNGDLNLLGDRFPHTTQNAAIDIQRVSVVQL